MIWLWSSVTAAALLMVIVRLRDVDRERQRFFATAGLQRRHAGTRRRDFGNTLRRWRSKIGNLLAGPVEHDPDLLYGGEHAARLVLRAMRDLDSTPAPAAWAPPVPEETHAAPAETVTPLQPATDTAWSGASAVGEGAVRVDTRGELRYPDPVAREMLQWRSGTLTLGDILAGGSNEAAALLESAARQEVVEQTVTVRTGGASRQLQLTALASRNPDGSLWGALLILRRP